MSPACPVCEAKGELFDPKGNEYRCNNDECRVGLFHDSGGGV